MPGLVASSSLGLTSSSTSSGTGPPPRPAASGLDVDWEIIDKKRFLGFGSISVFIVRFLVYPFSLVKTRMQVGRAESQRVFATIRDISGREGLRALYAGFSVSIFGAVPAQLVYISTYELVKSRVAGMTPQGVFAGGVYDEATKAFTSNLVGGACASLASQFVVVPIDVVAQRWVGKSEPVLSFTKDLTTKTFL
jgi:solute carrier family 25 protein 44